MDSTRNHVSDFDFHKKLLLLLREEVSKSGILEYPPYVDWTQKRSIRQTSLYFYGGLQIVDILLESDLTIGDISQAIKKIQDGKYGCEKIMSQLPTTLKKRKQINLSLKYDITHLSYLIEMLNYLASRNRPIYKERLKSYLDESKEYINRIIPLLESLT